MSVEVTGIVGTLNGKIVPVETPSAKPWYKIVVFSLSNEGFFIFTDGDKYCMKHSVLAEEDQSNFRPLKGEMRDDVHNAIERYSKKIGV